LDCVSRIFEKQSARELKNQLIEQQHMESPYLRQALEDCQKENKSLTKDFYEIAGTYNQLLTLQSNISNLNCYFRHQKAGHFNQILLDYKDTDKGCNLILAHSDMQNTATLFPFLLVKAYFHAMFGSGQSSPDFFKELNQALCSNKSVSQPVSVLVLEYDKQTHSIQTHAAGFRGKLGFMNEEGMKSLKLKVGSKLGTCEVIKTKYDTHPFNPGDKIFLVWANADVNWETNDWFSSITSWHFTMEIEDLVNQTWRDLPVRGHNRDNELFLLGLEAPPQ
jgi:hypothetical protein